MNGNPKNILPMLARELDNPLKDWFNVFETSSAPIVASVEPGPNGVDADADVDVDAIINYKI